MTEVYVLHGAGIGSLDDFLRVRLEAVGSDGRYFGRDFGAFNDGLRGGPGFPERDDDGYIVEWREHEQSRASLSLPFEVL
jgi:Barstar (barnase inhibitor)